jgi:hypothetical protein
VSSDLPQTNSSWRNRSHNGDGVGWGRGEGERTVLTSKRMVAAKRRKVPMWWNPRTMSEAVWVECGREGSEAGGSCGGALGCMGRGS